MKLIAIELNNGTVIPANEIESRLTEIETNVNKVHLLDRDGKPFWSFGKSWASWIESEKVWKCTRIGSGAYGDSSIWTDWNGFNPEISKW